MVFFWLKAKTIGGQILQALAQITQPRHSETYPIDF